MHSLPAQLTLFVGRTEEIAEIHALLDNPDCRLLTVVGVGGIGKTRLALQAASQLVDRFGDGLFFVPLQPVTSISFFISMVADAIGFKHAGSEEPQTQLFKYLANKEILLIIDNFEHLLESAHVLTAMLEAAPRVKLLITSREAVQLQEEWVYAIEGLDYPRGNGGVNPANPASADAIAAAEYSAVQLFVERARRVRRNFSLEAEAADIVAICQLVEGMPLALELAAAWTQGLSCRAIAGEIRHNLDFLATEWRNVPDRQRSMRAVFDYARNLLSPTEHEVFRRMSVFRGGFHRRAAEYVAGASLVTLGALVSHRLLRWEPEGRYQLHELLRQYADELLRESAQEKAQIDERHCVYYTEFLYKRLPDFSSHRQLEVIDEIDEEVENIRVAWRYALETRNLDAVGKAVQAVALFFESRSHQLEGIRLLEAAIERLGIFKSNEPAMLLLDIRFQELAWFYIRVGRFEEADVIAKRVQFCYEQLGIPPIEGIGTDPLTLASILATIGGEYEKAVRYGEQALQNGERFPHPANRPYAYYVLASAYLAQGLYENAKQHAEDAYAATQQIQERWFRAYCLVEMANAASALRDYAAARRYLEESYALRKEFNDPEGMAVALAYLGEVALNQGQFAEAQSYYERSVNLYENINDRGGLARSLDGLGNVRAALSDFEGAREHLCRALKLATEIQFVSLMCTIITSAGNLLVKTGNQPSGIALLAQMSRHPNSTTTCKERASLLLAEARAGIGEGGIDAELYEVVTTQDDTESVTELAAMAHAELSASSHNFVRNSSLNSSLPAPTIDGQPPASSPSPSVSPSLSSPLSPPVSSPQPETQPGTQPLVDPLTAREMEILNLIVDGLSNQQIASTLFITRGTVKWYTSQIYSKLGIDSRTQAIGRARELSLIS